MNAQWDPPVRPEYELPLTPADAVLASRPLSTTQRALQLGWLRKSVLLLALPCQRASASHSSASTRPAAAGRLADGAGAGGRHRLGRTAALHRRVAVGAGAGLPGGPVVSEVDVETAHGIVTSVITTRSIADLDLKVGSEVIALVKSTEVSIAKVQ